MNHSRLAVLLGIALLASSSGCLRVATAPIRAEARERGENMMSRLAAVPPEQVASFQTQSMTTHLQLSPAQRDTIAAINLKYAGQTHAIAAGADSLRTKLANIKTTDDEKDAELRQILSAEQFHNYEADKEELRRELRERVSAPAAGAQPS